MDKINNTDSYLDNSLENTSENTIADKPAIPELSSLKAELERVEYRSRFRAVLRSTTYILIVVAAVAVLVATVWLPILQIYGSSMSPTLSEKDIVVATKSSKLHQGDLVAFYIGNKILVKRCIAGPGQWVNIDKDGTVYVDGQPLEEPYIAEKSFGECNITLPYQVPENRWFCLGDHRATSVDSRHSSVGCVGEEQVVGKIIFRLWPLHNLGGV